MRQKHSGARMLAFSCMMRSCAAKPPAVCRYHPAEGLQLQTVKHHSMTALPLLSSCLPAESGVLT